MSKPGRKKNPPPADGAKTDVVPSPDGRFEIRHQEICDDQLFEKVYEDRWDVVDLRTGKIVATFTGRYTSERWGGGYGGGVCDVTFAKDGRAVLCKRQDGRVERVPVPPSAG